MLKNPETKVCGSRPTPGTIEVIRNKIQADSGSLSFVKKLGLQQWFVNSKDGVRNDS